MDRPILIVSSYVEPDPIGGNRLVAAQAAELIKQGVPVEVLSCPRATTWRGPNPDGSQNLAGLNYLAVEKAGIPFHLVDLPYAWSDRIPLQAEWESAIAWGRRALRKLRPSLVHLQFWQQWWWFAAAAQLEGIPLVYTACDYGTVCSRTVLVMGNDRLCSGVAGPLKCSWCVLSGRNLMGWANELAVAMPFVRPLANLAYSGGTGILARKMGVRIPVHARMALTLERARSILSRAERVIVTSPFARAVFQSAGARPERCEILPWFNDQQPLPSAIPDDGAFHLGMASRTAPDKGIHILLEALELAQATTPITLHLAGQVDNPYIEDLHRRYPHSAGRAKVIWEGWVPGGEMARFLSRVEAIAVPSLWYDNTPTAMVEALAHRRPVICSDVPSMTHLVKDGVNGLTFELGNPGALARCIERLADSKELLHRLAGAPVVVPSSTAYARRLAEIYAACLNEPLARTAANA